MSFNDVVRAAARGEIKGVVLDSNILLLYFVAALGLEWVGKFKRTRAFEPGDVGILEGLLEHFPQVVTTPNILTEVSNMLGSFGEPKRREVLGLLGRGIELFQEEMIASRVAAAEEPFRTHGLTDCSILCAARTGWLVVTDDLALAGRLEAEGALVLNFNHLRAINWSQQ